MSNNGLDNIKAYIVILIFLSIVTGSVALLKQYWPKYEGRFFEIALLDGDKKANDYFPTEDSSIYIGTPVNWYIYLHNHMASDQKVIIKVKLIDFNTSAPDDLNHIPSPFEPIIEYPIQIHDKETQHIPFKWSIYNVDPYNETIIIKSILLNDEIIDTEFKLYDNRCRFIFELWVYDEQSDMYLFEWKDNEEIYSASLTVWFQYGY